MFGGSVIKEKKETDLEAEARKEAKRKETRPIHHG